MKNEMQIVHLLAGTLKLIVIDWNGKVEILDPTKAKSECQSVGDYPQWMYAGGAENFGNEFIVACGTVGSYIEKSKQNPPCLSYMFLKSSY